MGLLYGVGYGGFRFYGGGGVRCVWDIYSHVGVETVSTIAKHRHT